MGNAGGKPLDQQPPKSHGSFEVTFSVFLQKKNVFDLNDQVARLADKLWEDLGGNVDFQLVSDEIDQDTGVGKRSGVASLEGWSADLDKLTADEGKLYRVRFNLDKDFGTPGAVLVDNHHPDWFFLSYIIVELPDSSQIQFSCNSWIYNRNEYNEVPRIFFSNKAYVLSETPPGLLDLRYLELEQLRGDGQGERSRPDRIYDYDVYNDLGDPDKDPELYARTTLGGSKDFPYPRRCRTGRARTKTDPSCERPTELAELVYIPRDERFGHIKKSDFLGSSIKSFSHAVVPAIETVTQGHPDFEDMDAIMDLYSKGIDLSSALSTHINAQLRQAEFKDPLEIVRELTDPDTGDTHIIKFPVPQVIQVNKVAWASDDEFARQLLAGLNPMVIERLTEFPPMSKLDPHIYGPQASSIRPRHIEPHLEGFTVDEALQQNKLFILDYHDVYLPYLERINALESKEYASRSILFLTREGTLKLVAIELSLPPLIESGQKKVNRVFVPPSRSHEISWVWQLAKSHVAINDAGYHQLISHWLQTHGAIEPFIIATHRQLSAMHPIHILLVPHYKNTMNINAISRKILINGYTGQFILGGIIERAFSPRRYSMEMSSIAYKSWHFHEQGLPADLIKRGMAIKDSNGKHGLSLVIEDYPFAVDGLEIWSAINEWVKDYVGIYYKNDKMVEKDTELQRWWKEVIEVGHGDKSDEFWIDLRTVDALVEVATTIIWVASAHHAAVNFGQFSYGAFMPNKPTMGRKLIPNDNDVYSNDFQLLHSNPTSFYLQSVSSQTQAIIVMATLEILSTHASDEEYLGNRTSSPYWTNEKNVLEAFQKFSLQLAQIEKNISSRNANPSLKNRHGLVDIPYTLMYPSSTEGLTGKGIPNSTSI